MISADLRSLRTYLTNLALTERMTRELFLEAMTQLEIIADDVEELEQRQVPPAARLQGGDSKVVNLADRRQATRVGPHA